jgi:hypothetical protein
MPTPPPLIASPDAMRQIFLITSERTANQIMESWFVQNLVLQGLPLAWESEAASLSGATVVYLEVGIPNLELVRSLAARGNKVVLFHMGDEAGTNFDRTCYLACDLVLRNYFFEQIFGDPEIGPRTIWVPNGFKSGVGPRRPDTLRKASRRRFLATFLGWIDNKTAFANERATFRDIALRHPDDVVLRATSHFGGGYNPGLYAMGMEHSIFAPCPAGNSPETIRLYDALELGCIPVSLGHAFLTARLALADPPFPILSAWAEFPALMARMRVLRDTQPAALDALQATCVEWWSTVKAGVASRVAARLLELRRS